MSVLSSRRKRTAKIYWKAFTLSALVQVNAQADQHLAIAYVSVEQSAPFIRKFVGHDGTLSNMQVIRGETREVDHATAVDSYFLEENATLNITGGGRVNTVRSNNSVVNVQEGDIADGLILAHSVAYLNEASLRNEDGFGLSIGSLGINPEFGSSAIASNSNISGYSFGAAVGLYGALSMDNTVVSGTSVSGSGMLITNGTIEAKGNSVIQGAVHGVVVNDGYDFYPAIGPEHNTYIKLDGSTIRGGSGAAINIGKPINYAVEADIAIQNGSVLYAGNGNLIEVHDGSTVNVLVDDSVLDGRIIADASSHIAITLQNRAQVIGELDNVNSLLIRSGAIWQMREDTSINLFSLEGGQMSFNGERFHTLSLNKLAGNGIFDMRVNLDTAEGDLLQVNGEASGHHLLNVKNTGVEAVPAEFEPLRIVHTEGGDAQFGLLGNRVDLGAYSYLLEQQGNDWFIVGEGKTISPSTQSALALFNAGPAIWNSELTTLRSRMGEVRGQEEGGGWIRSYGNRFNASTGSGLDYQQKQQGLSFGADAPIPVGTGELVVGLMGGYNKSDLDLSRGTSGTVNSYYVGTYGTWLFDDGYYLDGVLKFNRFRNESKVAMSDGSKAKGRYTNAGVGGSIEFGKHIKLDDDYFIEPYTQLSAVSIGGDSYSLNNGMKAKNARTQSVLGKVGTTAGRNFSLDDGSVVQPYVRVAMAHEFARSNDVTVNETRFDNNLFGSRAELGAGVSVTLSKRVQLHADFDYMKGKHVEQPWGANLGLKLAF